MHSIPSLPDLIMKSLSDFHSDLAQIDTNSFFNWKQYFVPQNIHFSNKS
jgi:hypothetical protein